MSGTDAVKAFIARWQGQEGGQERANYAMFLTELCDVLGLSHPDPANASTESNDYVFERVVKETARDGSVSSRRIDLYRKGSFVLEAKQSRWKGGAKEVAGQQNLFGDGDSDDNGRGRRGAERAWDVLMLNARRQAEDYVRLLPSGHEPPPFVLVCDVGHCLEVYANFRRDGKAYDQFPDRRGFRVYLEDLRQPAVRDRLVAIWQDPMSLDPARHSARVTRDIAARLAAVSKALEQAKYRPDEVAMFLMRLLFTMFAEDVELLPKASFTKLLADCESKPSIFPGMLEDLWRTMNEGGFTATIRAQVPRFNGEFFRAHKALPLGREEIGELRRAAEHDWRDVEPAIFGALLEQALDPRERRRLGAHYTPRAYVERLVVATVIDPLREEWDRTLSTAERQKADGRAKDAVRTIARFHGRLCATRILDPACGTGNFLYVSLELMKRLEGEVLEALVDLGGQEAFGSLERHSVDPHTFLGLEVNPRAAAIAELVLWIGYLQWHFRTRGGKPAEPILRAFRNIEVKDAVLTWDGYPLPRVEDGKELYPGPRRPEWPEAEYVVGNPPFIGGKDLRSRLGDAYAEALWAAHPQMNESADFVMYWWDRAADLLTRDGTKLRRFGLVTTNSITQVFQRRVTERHLKAKKPVSIAMAIPDHPWTKATRDAAAVRIAMTVVEPGGREGRRRVITAEHALDTDAPVIAFADEFGRINADLSVGVDLTTTAPLLANEGICSPGVKLHGSGFIITPAEAAHLGLGRRPGLDKHIRHYRNGRDLTARPRGVMVIDLFGLEADEVRTKYPEVYQHLLNSVKPERERNNRASYRDNWWIFGEPRRELRPALAKLRRYIVTVETMRQRSFLFLETTILADNKLVCFALDDAWFLGVLSSSYHVRWAIQSGGWLGAGNDPVYVKSRCFDPFPFPDGTDQQKAAIRAAGEELDAHRKNVLAEHPHLTLTGLYNVLERLRGGAKPDELDKKQRRIFDDGLVLILKELHERLDAAVAAAYGWPADLPAGEALANLVALNKERAADERRGIVRWLRPDYQIPRFGTPRDKARQIEAELVGGGAKAATGKKVFPAAEIEQTAAVMAVLLAAAEPLDADAIAASFRRGRRNAGKVREVLSALTRMGIASSPDGGRTFTARRAA